SLSWLSRLKDNLAALDHRDKVTDEVIARIDAIAGNKPTAPQRF
ncbi:MAG: aldo/keto reductase, partial [Hyphomicrobiales bacterium]